MGIETIDVGHLIAFKAKDDAPISRYLHGIKAVVFALQGMQAKAREVNLSRTRCLINTPSLINTPRIRRSLSA
jgi:hypothetical protein